MQIESQVSEDGFYFYLSAEIYSPTIEIEIIEFTSLIYTNKRTKLLETNVSRSHAMFRFTHLMKHCVRHLIAKYEPDTTCLVMGFETVWRVADVTV